MALLISFDECSKQPQPDHGLLKLPPQDSIGFNNLIKPPDIKGNYAKIF